MRRFGCASVVAVTLLLLSVPSWSETYSFTESLAADPFAASGGSFSISNAAGMAPDDYGQFTWQSWTPSKYVGDPAGSLRAVYDSTRPTVRLERPLPVTLEMDRDFTLGARVTILSQDFHASPADFFQINFALGNHAATGARRTSTYDAGSGDWLSDSNCFDNVEFTYFPNVSVFGGPTLQVTVMGAELPGQSAFGNFASPYFAEGDLGDNTGGQATTLPLDAPLDVKLAYDALSQVMTLSMSRVNADGSLTPLLLSDTGVIDVDLSGAEYSGGGFSSNNFDKLHPFTLDRLIVTSYLDNGDYDPTSPSLFARVDFDAFTFEASSVVPEPGTLLLAGSGLLMAVGWLRRRS